MPRASRSTGSRAVSKGFPLLAVAAWGTVLAYAFWPTGWLALTVGVLVLLGVAAGWRRPATAKLAVLSAAAYPAWSEFHDAGRKKAAREDAVAIRALVSAEEQILALTPVLRDLSGSLMNLKLPDARRRKWFADGVNPLEGNNSPWLGRLDSVDWFDHAKFYFVDGILLPSGRFRSKVGMKGLARMKSGEWNGIAAKQIVEWEPTGDSDPEWRIVTWETTDWKSTAAPRLWFENALEEVIPRRLDRRQLQRSEHHEAAVAFYKGGAKEVPHPYFSAISANQKPGISVADVDSDGDDDIYVTVRLGKNRLLENQGNGTFREAAAGHGLDIRGHSTCAIFADFDNDGDADLMLGRSLLPSMYLENTGGWFTERKLVLPKLAISMSAADFNSDGLLDVYISTYRPAVLGGSSPAGGVAAGSSNWPDEFLFPEVAKEFYRRHAKLNEKKGDNLFPNLLNQLGPPNALLVNRGNGVFEPAAENRQIGIWRNTLQATWSDYDEDGDPDLYVANDWAPDHLFRNDGPDGFTDVTGLAGTTAFGFAMGATWGDYDNDGRRDLYVSNMYSKAGLRITRKVAGLRGDYAESAAGNWLYRQSKSGMFELVSGLEPPALEVARAGWSWGGQFADFNNDGWLDLYVVNGYFTAPREVASDVDL